MLEVNRRIRWLWGAFEQLRAMLVARLPDDDCQQIDTLALPVKHTSRVRGADQWTGPGNDLTTHWIHPRDAPLGWLDQRFVRCGEGVWGVLPGPG